MASATVHLAEVGTTLVSGAAHARFGNVQWRVVAVLALPGAAAAFVGAVLLTSVPGDAPSSRGSPASCCFSARTCSRASRSGSGP